MNISHIRDIAGSDSFYYSQIDGDFVYAEKIGTLLNKISSKPKPNLNAMHNFIHRESVSPHETMYEGIYRLPPGHKLTLENNIVQISRHWKPEEIQIDYNISFDEATQKFRHLLEKVIKNHLPKDAPVGCELSGGFDSSSVFCIASQMHSDVTAFVMDFDQPSCNESHYADAVLSNCNSKAIRHNCSNLDYKNKYNMAYNYALSPHWPLWITFTMFAPLMEIQRERGINTVFTGQFGDHVLFGHPLSIANYLYQGRIDRFLYEWFKLDNKYAWSKMALSSMLSPKQKNFLKKLIGKKTIPAADNPSDTKKDVYGILSVLRQDRIDRMSNNIHAMSSNNNFDKAVKEKYGINYIDPLGDDEIVNFLFSLPYEFFFSQGNYRHFHIEAMRDLLPQKVIERKDKAEFSVILKQQIAAIDRKELWEDSNIVRLGIIDNDMIDKFEAMFLSDTLEGYNLQQYWRMLNLEFWYIYNQYMDKD